MNMETTFNRWCADKKFAVEPDDRMVMLSGSAQPLRLQQGDRRYHVAPYADAHIVIGIDAGRAGVSLIAFMLGKHDATYVHMTEQQLLETELPKLLAELRQQLQGLSGSTVTE